MRFWLSFLFLVLLQAPGIAFELTDSAGRNVTMPQKVEKAFAAGAPASVLLYVLAPDLLAGWPRSFREEEKAFVTEAARNLPEVGMITGRGGSANIETVLRMKPDIIIDFGSVRDTYASLATATQEQTGIPYLLIDGRFEVTPASLRLAGLAVGRPERAEKLARYIEERFAEIDAALTKIAPEKRPKVYLARSSDGLESGTRGSINTEIIERAGGRNVVDGGDSRRNLVRVSIEQILAADPDIILTWDRAFFDRVGKDPLWQDVRAVKDGRVYLSPMAPFGWIDRPPSLNRMIGLMWVAKLFYPELFPRDLRDTAREFYTLFYHVTPTDADLDKLIAWSQGTVPAQR